LNTTMILGLSFLASIGFTMSLFINSLAFENQIYSEQAKMGILLASFLSGLTGYAIIRTAIKKLPEKKPEDSIDL
jgi:Na+:H+ antiporter, NhaA family